MDENKLGQFFKSYHQFQLYSLSGYFHISSELNLNALIRTPAIKEWLDSHHYFICPCPSQSEEIVKIGVLCYSSIFISREDLKHTIMDHPDWTPIHPESPPIFDIFIGELNTSSKKTKMLFVSSEKSKQEEVADIFKAIYDGTQKSIPKWFYDDIHPNG
jgi:hypothetical protein